MRLCATIIITPVSQPGTELHQMHHRLLYNLDKFSVWLTLYWPSKTPTAEVCHKYQIAIQQLSGHWSGSLSSAGVAAVGVDHADEARRLAPRPLAHHHHVHAAQEEAVIETVRPETLQMQILLTSKHLFGLWHSRLKGLT